MSPIRTAIIGFGTAGRVFHAPLVSSVQGLVLDAVVTSSAERAEQVRVGYPATRVLATVDELWRQPDRFDLVVVASPPDTHLPFARRAIDAGLAVVIDKPVAASSADARELLNHAREVGARVTVFQNRRWDGDFITVREAIHRGDLGEIRQFESAFEWWKPQLTDRWKDRAPSTDGAGLAYDLGAHLVDQALQLFGRVERVHAELDLRRPGAVSDDDSFISLTHANGVRSRLWMSAVSPRPRPRFRVVGSSGVLTTFGLDPQERQLASGRRPGDDGYGVHDDARAATIDTADGSWTMPVQPGDYAEFYRRTVAWLAVGGSSPVDPSHSLDGVALIERCVAGA